MGPIESGGVGAGHLDVGQRYCMAPLDRLHWYEDFLQLKCNYLQRTVPKVKTLMYQIYRALREVLSPMLFWGGGG